ncbi:(2Fe-2S)-binding protein [Endothiovibrio diazotrophicus]
MYVCLCKGVTDRRIREAVRGGARSMHQLKDQLGVCSQCGRCACSAKRVLKEAKAEMRNADDAALAA